MNHLDDLIGLSRRALAASMLSVPEPERLAVDATAGNGHDTVFLATLAGPAGRVWAFDVQRAAVEATRNRLTAKGDSLAARVTLMCAGHEAAGEVLPPETQGRLRAAVFNLGFLPGSDKTVTTGARNTLAALEGISARLAAGGVISTHAYLGHPGGREEGEAVRVWFAALPWKVWRVAEYVFCNKQRNPETLFLAERMA